MKQIIYTLNINKINKELKNNYYNMKGYKFYIYIYIKMRL